MTISPRRQMSVQFSGGEPTLSPFFLDAIKYSPRSATSRCSAPPTASASRRSPGFAKKAKEAGLRMAYLQFDGVTQRGQRSHRKIGNLYDVKLRAIEELARGRNRRHPRGHHR